MAFSLDERHKYSYVVVVGIACICCIVAIVMTALAQLAPNLIIVSDDYNETLDVLRHGTYGLTPPSWTYYMIWILAYIWCACWLVYGITTIWRSTGYGFLYLAPGHMHYSIYVLFSCGMLVVIVWLYTIARRFLYSSLILAILGIVFFTAALVISYMRLHRRGFVLIREQKPTEIWLVRILVQNGLQAILAWWVYLTIVNLDMTLTMSGALLPRISTTISISLLALITLAFFFSDILLLDSVARYCFSGYIVFIVAMLGSSGANWNSINSNSIYLAFAFTTVCLALAIKMILLVYRHRRKPMWVSNRMFVPSRNYGTLDEKSGQFPAIETRTVL